MLSDIGPSIWRTFRFQSGSVRGGAVLSAALHVTVVVLFAFGLPSFVDPPTDTVIAVELVMLEEEPTPEPEPAPEEAAEEVEPEPEPPQEQAKVVPEPVAPEPDPEPEPELVVPKPKPEAAPVLEKAAAPPKPKRRPKVSAAMHDKLDKNREEPKLDQLTSILRNVERLREQPQQSQDTKPAETKGPVKRKASVFEQNAMVRAIQDQLRNCWRIDPGARGAEDIVVEIRVLLGPDGSVNTVEVLDVVRMVQDSYFRSAAENATRAISRCSPFRLPVGKYEVWKQLTLRFDPRRMFGT